VFWCLAASNLHLQASLVNFKSRQLARIRCWVELELNILLNFWFRLGNEIQREFIKPLLFSNIEKILKKLSIGVTCAEYQLSTSASCNVNLLTKWLL
jgi:hypothetical protein|tara:strand:+ start:1412 stop:1702 length:291 start_codon:yes stop_codon:yes gene_type:complete